MFESCRAHRSLPSPRHARGPPKEPSIAPLTTSAKWRRMVVGSGEIEKESPSLQSKRDPPTASASHGVRSRVEQRGKFLFTGKSKLYIRGVAYGTFRPNEDGALFPPREAAVRDFAAM